MNCGRLIEEMDKWSSFVILYLLKLFDSSILNSPNNGNVFMIYLCQSGVHAHINHVSYRTEAISNPSSSTVHRILQHSRLRTALK